MELDPDDVSRAFGRPVTSYDVEPIDPQLRIHSVTGGVYRVRAGADTLVIKAVRHSAGATRDHLWGADADVGGRNYWKREWLAFDSGLLDRLPGRLRGPRTLLTTQPSDAESWIWMEDVQGRSGANLRLDDFDAIAHALGTMQGAYAADPSTLPDDAWLSRNWLPGWVDVCGRFIEPLSDDARWTDERLAPMAALRERVVALWESHGELLRITAEAPATLVHWDFWPANLYVAGDGDPTTRDVVAIDWSQVGISGVTHDLDQITLDTVWMHMRPDESLDELERRVLPAYVAGLGVAGCDVSAAQVRRWYAAAAAARYAWMAGGQPDVVSDPEARAAQERRYDRDISAVVATKARVVAWAVELGEWVLG